MSKKFKIILSISLFLLIVLIISHFTLGSPFSFPFLDWFFNQDFAGTEMTREDAYGLNLTGMEIVARVGDKFEGENREKGWMDGQIIDIRPLGFYTGKFARQHFAVIELPNINYWDLRGSKDWKSTATSTKEFKKYLSIADTERKRDYFIDFRWLLDKGYITKDQYFDIYDRDKTHDQISLDFTNIEQLFSHEDKKERLARLYKKENKVLTFFKRMIPSAYAITNGTYSIGSGLDYDTVTLFEAAIEAQLTGDLTGEHADEETSISGVITFDTDTNGYLLKLTAASGAEHNGGAYGNGARINFGTASKIRLNETTDGDLDDVEISKLAFDISGTANTGILVEDGGDGGLININRLLIKGNSIAYYGLAIWGDAKNCRATNCIIYGIGESGSSSGIRLFCPSNVASTVEIYNNTVVKCYSNILQDLSGITGTLIVKNNITQAHTGRADFGDDGGGFGTYSKNVSEDDTSPDAAYRNKEVSFVDEANDDFHLAGNDVAARNEGEDLSGTFTEDIDGETRGYRGWDIGADETFVSVIVDSSLVNKLTDGLVGHWTFNGQDMDWASTTAEVLDRSGNSNNGNVVNGATPVIGISGQALEFDGENDYMTGNGYEYDVWSISVWIKAVPAGWAGIGGYTDSNKYRRDLGITSGNNVTIAYGANKWRNSSYGVADNEWHHIVGVFDGSTPSVRVDNELVSLGVEQDADLGTNASKLKIGDFLYEGYPFDGIIDEVRIYDRALSADEIGELYRAVARRLQPDAPMVQKDTGGLVGHWTFNGQDMDWASTTAEALDRSGNSNNGNVVNGATPVIGISGQALEFDGKDDYVDWGSEISFSTRNTTWTFWTKKVVSASDMSVLGTGGTSSFNNFRFRNSALRVESIVNTDEINTNGFTDDGNWHFWAISCNATSCNIYEDNVDRTNDGTFAEETINLDRIGSSGTNYFNGTIDEVRIYDRALSADEVGELYRAGAGRMKLK